MWAQKADQTKHLSRKLEEIQRLSTLRMISAYRTVLSPAGRNVIHRFAPDIALIHPQWESRLVEESNIDISKVKTAVGYNIAINWSQRRESEVHLHPHIKC